MTWHAISEVPDAGDILVQRIFPLSANETALSLNWKCYDEGLLSFRDLLYQIDAGNLSPAPQDLSQRTFYALSDPFPADGVMRWTNSVSQLDRLVRALTSGTFPAPPASPRLLLGDRGVVVKRCRVAHRAPSSAPGTVIAAADETMTVACVDGDIELLELADLLGNRLAVRDLLGAAWLKVGARLDASDEELALGWSVTGSKFSSTSRFGQSALGSPAL